MGKAESGRLGWCWEQAMHNGTKQLWSGGIIVLLITFVAGGSYSQMTSKEIICLANIQRWCTCCTKSGGAEVPSGGTGAQTILPNTLKSTSWKIVSRPRYLFLVPSPGSYLLPPVGNAPEEFWSSWGYIPMWPWKYMQPSCSSTWISVTGKVSGTWQWMESLYVSWIFQVSQLLFGFV